MLLSHTHNIPFTQAYHIFVIGNRDASEQRANYLYNNYLYI